MRYEIWLGPGADELLHLAMASLSSSCDKGGHSIAGEVGISLRILGVTWRLVVELYVWWRACHRSSRLVHGWLLCFIALVAGRALHLIQFIRSQGHLLEVAISWIFFSKKDCFAALMVCL